MFDRVKVTSATTGTGTLTLDAGASAGFRSMYDVSPGTPILIPYLAQMGDDWELGFGTYNGANPGTLARTAVTASSTGSAISWAAGTKSISIAPSVEGYVGKGLRHNWVTGGAPSATDDEADGYGAGSLWLSGSEIFVCVNASAGSAIWVLTASPFRKLGGGSIADIAFDSAFMDPTPRSDFNVAMYRDDSSSIFKQRRARIFGGAETSGTTPSNVVISAPAGGGVMKGTVTAVINVGANIRHTKAWDLAVVFRSTGAAATVVGSPAITAIAGDTELASASVSAAAAGTTIEITCTGVTGEDVTWAVSLDVNECVEP